MSARPQAQCGPCIHYRSPFDPANIAGLERPFCAAFPDGIPAAIWENRVDHRQPVEGDHGVQWEGQPGEPFPEYAMVAAAPDTDPMRDILTAADAANLGPHDGAMIALVPSAADAARLAVEGGEPVGELHCTLLYLGPADALDEAARDRLRTWARDMAEGGGAVVADAFAVAAFNPAGDEPCVVLVLGGSDLAEFHEIAAADVADQIGLIEQRRPWVAHLTLAYPSGTVDGFVMLGDGAHSVNQRDLFARTGPVTFDRLRLAIGGEIFDIPLGRGEPARGMDGEDDDEEDIATDEVDADEVAPASTASAGPIPGRERWSGCPRCLDAMHDGPCSSRV